MQNISLILEKKVKFEYFYTFGQYKHFFDFLKFLCRFDILIGYGRNGKETYTLLCVLYMRFKYQDQPKAYVVTAYPDVDRSYPGMWKH